MTDLLIRNIDPELKRQLEERARQHKRSLSEEAKALIQGALAVPASRKLGTELAGLIPIEYRSDDIVFETFEPVAEPPDFK
jgi:plasmid stability protein